MIVNNILTLIGIWAMLFAGKENTGKQSDFFLILNFFTMFVWGVFHVFMGGLRGFPLLIHNGGLDTHLMSPRPTWLSVSVTDSDLPAWGDVLLGTIGLTYFSFQHGWFFFGNLFLMVLLALSGVICFFIGMGSLSFWLRRSDTLNNSLINMLLAVSTYPIIDKSQKFFVFLIPALTLGVIPVDFLLEPTIQNLAYEFIGCGLLIIAATFSFSFGLRHYQSSPIFTSSR